MLISPLVNRTRSLVVSCRNEQSGRWFAEGDSKIAAPARFNPAAGAPPLSASQSFFAAAFALRVNRLNASPMQGSDAFWSGRMAPSLADFERMARRAFDDLPDTFKSLVGDVAILIAEFPEDEVLAELEMDSPFDLLGLFHGVGLAHAAAVPP